MTELEKHLVKTLLDWRDAALNTCEHLGMYGEEYGAYIQLCRIVGKTPNDKRETIKEGDRK